MRPARNCWRTKWQSKSTCFVRSWNTGFFAIWIAALLSEWSETGSDGLTVRSERRRTSQVISATTRHIERYSTSADERDMGGCFLDFQEIRDPLKLIKNPLTEWRESRQSQKARSCRDGSELRKRPKLGVDKRYRRQCIADSKWGRRGCCIYWLKCWTANERSGRVWVK